MAFPTLLYQLKCTDLLRKTLFLNPLNSTKLVKYHTNIDITLIDETKHETLVVTVIVVWLSIL